MANTPAERTYVFPAVAVLATVCTVAWWRDALPVPSWFGTDPSPWNLGFSYLLASVLHLDALHLVFNLYWVQRWAPPLERRHGALAVVTLLLWLAFGTGGVEWIAGSSGVGLSGLVYGLLGFMWASERPLKPEQRIVDDRDVRFFTGWFFLCIVTTWIGLWRVGNVAHGSGAALGLLAGWATTWPRSAAVAMGVATALGSLFVGPLRLG